MTGTPKGIESIARPPKNLHFTVYWVPIALDEGQLIHLKQWLAQLDQHLKHLVPVASITFEPLPESEVSRYTQAVALGNIPDPADYGIIDNSFLVVTSSQDHPLRDFCLEINKVAESGCCHIGLPQCNVYQPDDAYTLWHEIYHLFGAEDCYTVGPDGEIADEGPTCGEADCIMQYGVKSQLDGKRPHLCSENVELIKSWLDMRARSP
jgi:hypothetical protein